jgi:hypothetical protein
MNAFITDKGRLPRMAAVIGCAALAALALRVNAQSANGTQRLQVIEVDDLDLEGWANSRTLEVRIDNGEVSVKRNGKEVPKDQIRKEKGRIVILDDDGNEARDLNLMLGQGPDPFLYKLGDSSWDGAVGWMNKNEGTPPKVMLGVHMTQPGKALEKHLHLEEGATTMLSGVYQGLSAHEAGLEEFDIITKVNGETPADASSIMKHLAGAEAGQTITFTVIHEGKTKDVDVKLEKYDADALKTAKLLDKTPGADVDLWLSRRIEPLQFDPGQFFVAPDASRWQGLQEFMLRQPQPGPPEGQPDINDQLQRLDKRMAELEQLLEKLIESREKGR